MSQVQLPASVGWILAGLFTLFSALPLWATEPLPAALPPLPPANSAFSQASGVEPVGKAASDRYGWFNTLDQRSVYGQFWFPEPLRADEGDVDNELRLDYFHSEKAHHQFDQVKTEIEYAIGLMTLEIAGGYESDRSLTPNDADGFDHETDAGFTNIELAARYPFLQFVSPGGFFDDTFVAGLEVAPPTHTKVSEDLEIVPKIFNLLRLGEHFSLQTGGGLSTLVGPQARGLSVLEYNAVFGYELTHEVLPLPLTSRITPIFEIDGETVLNHDDRGINSLLGTVGCRFDLDAIGPLQPRLGLGYTFPLDQGGRQELNWGVVTSLIFEY